MVVGHAIFAEFFVLCDVPVLAARLVLDYEESRKVSRKTKMETGIEETRHSLNPMIHIKRDKAPQHLQWWAQIQRLISRVGIEIEAQ